MAKPSKADLAGITEAKMVAVVLLHEWITSETE